MTGNEFQIGDISFRYLPTFDQLWVERGHYTSGYGGEIDFEGTREIPSGKRTLRSLRQAIDRRDGGYSFARLSIPQSSMQSLYDWLEGQMLPPGMAAFRENLRESQ